MTPQELADFKTKMHNKTDALEKQIDDMETNLEKNLGNMET